MTVNELIEQLKNYPADMRVLTLGGDVDGGHVDIDELDTLDIVFNVDGYGQNESVILMDNLPNSDSQWKKNGLNSGKCVIIR